MKLYFRRLGIYFKNHIDAIPLIFCVLSMVVFTFAIYVYTPLDVAIVYPRWPWAQGLKDPKAPLAMIQFFACLASILNVVTFLNYRTTKKKFLAVVFYSFSAIQVINDIYFLSEIYRHLGGVDQGGKELYYLTTGYPTNAGLIFTYVHLVLLILSVVLLAFAPLIQKYTKRIKLKPISNQDKEIVQDTNEEIDLEEESSNKNMYGYNLDDLDDEFVNSILNKSE